MSIKIDHNVDTVNGKEIRNSYEITVEHADRLNRFERIWNLSQSDLIELRDKLNEILK